MKPCQILESFTMKIMYSGKRLFNRGPFIAVVIFGKQIGFLTLFTFSLKHF